MPVLKDNMITNNENNEQMKHCQHKAVHFQNDIQIVKNFIMLSIYPLDIRSFERDPNICNY